MISRLEAKDAEVVVSDVRVSVFLEEIIDSLKPAAAAGQVFIHCDCQPLSIKANPQQMKELLSNLVSNAVKIQPTRWSGMGKYPGKRRKYGCPCSG